MATSSVVYKKLENIVSKLVERLDFYFYGTAFELLS